MKFCVWGYLHTVYSIATAENVVVCVGNLGKLQHAPTRRKDNKKLQD